MTPEESLRKMSKAMFRLFVWLCASLVGIGVLIAAGHPIWIIPVAILACIQTGMLLVGAQIWSEELEKIKQKARK